jgi:anti-sigma B factor antagonist
MIQDRPGTHLSSVCSISTERDLEKTIVRLYGEFDLSAEEGFRAELARLLEGNNRTLVLDLRGLTFMDSTGLRALISLHKLTSLEGFDFTVMCDGGHVRRVLHETGLDRVLPVVDT